MNPAQYDLDQALGHHDMRLRTHRHRRLFTLAISLPLLAILVPAVFLSLRFASRTEAVWMNDAWAYRAKIPVTAHSAPETNVYFTKTIDTSDTTKFQTDCGDLRFTDINGDLLQYYIASGCSSASTVVHVLVPSFPAGASDYYYYYGNPSAPNGFSSSDFTAGSGVTVGSVGSEEKSKGPIAYWAMDEGQGTTLQDSGSKNLDATFGASTAAPTWKTGSDCVSGACVYFDGSDDQVDLPITLPSGSWSFSGWFKHNNDIGVANDYIFWQQETQLNIDHATDAMNVRLWNGTTAYTMTSNTTFDPGEWYFVTFIYDTSTIYLYVNGRLDKSTAASGNAANGIGYIGRDETTASMYRGYVDEYKVYNYARTAAEVRADFAARGGVKGVTSTQGAGNQKSLSDGLVGYWKMDETSWTNDCSTTTILDGSGNALHGSSCPNSTGPTATALGKFGASGDFDGTDDQVRVADSSLLEPSSDMTISAWIYMDQLASTKGEHMTIVDKVHTATPWHSYRLYINTSNTLNFEWINDSGTAFSTYSSAALSASRWYHVAAVKIGSQMHLYIDGVEDTVLSAQNMTGVIYPSAGTLRIGAADVALYRFDGKIDEVRLYNRAVSLADIRIIHSWSPGPVGYWKMDDDVGQTVSDSSGNGFNGVLGDSSSIEADDPLWTPGKFGAATTYTANPANRHVHIDDHELLNIQASGNLTVSAWVRRTGSAEFDNAMVVIDKQDAGSAAGYGLRLAAPDCGTASSAGDFVCFFIYDGTDTYEVITTTTLTADSSWHHVSAVFDRTAATNVNIFIDGVAQPVTRTGTLGNIGSALNTDPLCVGVDQDTDCDGNLNQFHGSIDELRIYNYARTPGQITEDMNGGHPLGGSPVGSQIALYRLDEQQGQSINSGGNQGTAANGTLGANSSVASDDPSWKTAADCKSNGCLSFDGTNDYAQTTDLSARMDNTSLTISAWVYPTSSGANQHLIGIRNDGSADFYMVQLSGGTSVEARFRNSGGTAYTITATSSLTLNTWQHIALTYDGTSLTYFRNGKAMNTLAASGTITDTAANFGIGGDGDDGNNPFTGKIDEVKVYTDALSFEEVALDFNGGAAVNYGTTSPNESTQLSDGAGLAPVAYWNFDEKTGTSANDKSGNSYTGTWNGTLGNQWVSGKIGSAAAMNGSNNYLATSLGNSVKNQSQVTIELWFKLNTVGTAQNLYFEPRQSDGTTRLELRTDVSSTLLFGGRTPDSSGYMTFVDDVRTLSVNTWYHVAAVFDSVSDVHYLYLNGVPVSGSVSTAAFDNTDPSFAPRIGAGPGSAYVNGVIDDVKIYNYARTSSQVAYDYNRGGPVGYWRLDECAGTVANDSSGNGNTGTWSGSGGSQTSAGTCATASTAWGNGATGKFNSSLNFDGTDDYVSMSTPQLATATDFTISAWVKASATPSTATIYSEGRNASTGFIWFWINTQKLELRINDGTNVDQYTGTQTLNSGQWYHLVAVNTGQSTTLYIDGRVDTLAVNSVLGIGTPPTLDRAAIGQLYRSTDSNFFPGQIDEVRIYNYALSQSQVQKLYNGGASVNFGPNTGQP